MTAEYRETADSVHHPRTMKAHVVVPILAGLAAPAVADDGMALRSQIGFGATLAPDRVAVTSEGGYVGGAGDFRGHLAAEGTIVSGLSVFAIASYGENDPGQAASGRPALGAAYQISDPRRSPIGARVSLAYKPEGFSEAEGEIEGVTVLSHRFGGDVARALFAFGSDADGHESDGELGGSYLHQTTDRLALGASTRYRHAIGGTAMKRWDLIAGAVADLGFGRWRVEGMAGVGALQGSGAGPLGLVSIGIDL
jgi:hypothetical protein